jgi:hypothetical protein
MALPELPAVLIQVQGNPSDVMTAVGTKIIVNGQELKNVERIDYKHEIGDHDSIIRTRLSLVLAGTQVGVTYNPPPPPPPFTDREKRMARLLAEDSGQPASNFYDRARSLLKRQGA